MARLSIRGLLAAGATALSVIGATAVPTPPPANAASPVRNGRIAFERDGDIYTVHSDGTSVRRLTWNGDSHSPTFGPGGLRILYVFNGHIWMMGAAGRHKVRLPTGGGAGQPTWAPNATRFAFVRSVDIPEWGRSDELFVYTFATGRAVEITFGHYPYARFLAGVRDPAWSPRGDRILFSDLDLSNASLSAVLWTIRPDGSHPTVFAGFNGLLRDAADWAPGGQRVVYARAWSYRDAVGYLAPAVRRSDGTFVRFLPLRGNVYSAWSPDGRWIATTRPLHWACEVGLCDNAEPGLWLVRPDGSGAHRILTGAYDWEDLDWQPLQGS